MPSSTPGPQADRGKTAGRRRHRGVVQRQMLLISAPLRHCFCYAVAGLFAARLRRVCCAVGASVARQADDDKGAPGGRKFWQHLCGVFTTFFAAPWRRLCYAFCGAVAAPLLRCCCAFGASLAAPLLRFCGVFAASLLRFYQRLTASWLRFCGAFAALLRRLR